MAFWKNIKFWVWAEVEFPEEPFVGETATDRTCDLPPEGTKVCLDVLQFSSEFELNAIPSATASIALGRRADDVTKISEIHYYIDQLKLQLPVKIWCKADTSSGNVPDIEGLWPIDDFIIFEGYVTGSGFRRSQGGAELTLHMTHWLTDLNFSSVMSAMSHPLNPSQLYLPASHTPQADGGFGGLYPSPQNTSQAPIGIYVGGQLAMGFFLADTIIQDFWGGTLRIDSTQDNRPVYNGLKGFLVALTREDRLDRSQIAVLTASAGTTIDLRAHQNWEACRALARFEPNAELPDTAAEVGYRFGVPLGLKDYTDINGFIAKSIAQAIGKESQEAYSNVTFWDKLAGQFHSSYMFSICPLVRRALTVPFIPGLSTLNNENDAYVHRVLRTSHYESIELQANMPRPLRAVGLVIGQQYQSGGYYNNQPGNEYRTFGGWFDKMTTTRDQRYQEGLVMFKIAPEWLANIAQLATYAQATTGINAAISTALLPGIGPIVAALSPQQVFTRVTPLWDSYAQALYNHEILKGRQGTITGPVRFDIAPGSTIKVEATEDKYVKAVLHGETEQTDCDNSWYNFYYCAVLRVSTVIDCQNNRAMTSFLVGHIRDETENKSKATATNKHPIWQKCQWAGCSLIDDASFEPLATTSECE